MLMCATGNCKDLDGAVCYKMRFRSLGACRLAREFGFCLASPCGGY